MKRILCIYIVVVVLIAITVDAKQYFAVLVRSDATSHDKQAVAQKLANRTGDTNLLTISKLRRWRQVSDTNKIWFSITYDNANGHFEFTEAEIDAWKDATLDNPNRTQAGAFDNPLWFEDQGLTSYPHSTVL